DAPARKTDLAGMVVQVGRASREQQMQALGPLHQRDEYRRLDNIDEIEAIGLEAFGEYGFDLPVDGGAEGFANEVQLYRRVVQRQEESGRRRNGLGLGVESRNDDRTLAGPGMRYVSRHGSKQYSLRRLQYAAPVAKNKGTARVPLL